MNRHQFVVAVLVCCGSSKSLAEPTFAIGVIGDKSCADVVEAYSDEPKPMRSDLGVWLLGAVTGMHDIMQAISPYPNEPSDFAAEQQWQFAAEFCAKNKGTGTLADAAQAVSLELRRRAMR